MHQEVKKLRPEEIFSEVVLLRAIASPFTDSQTINNLYNASQIEQLKLFYHEGESAAYIAYAMISADNVRMAMKHLSMPKYFYEWQDGYYPMLVDVGISPKWRYHAIKMIKDYLVSKRCFCYIKNQKFVISEKHQGKVKLRKIRFDISG